MLLNGLAAGFSLEEMRHMKYTHLMHFLFEWEDMNGAEVDETRDATPADVMELMKL